MVPVQHPGDKGRIMNDYKILLEQIRELKEQNDLCFGAVRYWRNLYHQKNDELAILKNAIDEFLKRHPEFTAEFNEIIKQEEEESEEEED